MSARRRRRETRPQRRSGKPRSSQKSETPFTLPYGKENAVIFSAGIFALLLGYFCLSQPPVDGFLSLTLAPILLVIGYCVLIPIALLKTPSRNKSAPGNEDGQPGVTNEKIERRSREQMPVEESTRIE